MLQITCLFHNQIWRQIDEGMSDGGTLTTNIIVTCIAFNSLVCLFTLSSTFFALPTRKLQFSILMILWAFKQSTIYYLFLFKESVPGVPGVPNSMKFQNQFWLKTYTFSSPCPVWASLRLSWCVGTIVVFFVADFHLIILIFRQNIDRSLFKYDIICDIYNILKMRKAVVESMKFARMFSCRYQFSVLFMDRQNIISPLDTLITDIKGDDLKNQVSKYLGKKYLSPLSQNQKQVEQRRAGVLYGISFRSLISIPTRALDKNPIWIHYLIDTGSPATFLTQEAMLALTGPSHQILQSLLVTINGIQHYANMSSHHFQDLNILGMDYLIYRKSLLYRLARRKKQDANLEIEF